MYDERLEEELQARAEEEDERRRLETLRRQQHREREKEFAKRAAKKLAQKAAAKAAESEATAVAGSAVAAAAPWVGIGLAIVVGLIVIFIIGVVIPILTVTSICYSRDQSGTLVRLGSAAGAAVGILPVDVCAKLGVFRGVVDTVQRGGIIPVPVQNPNIDQWNPLFRSAATANNLPYCFVRAIAEKESSGDPSAIGHDHTPPPPPILKWAPGLPKAYEPNNTHDPFNLSSAPKHNLDWNFSHGIGLMQITIFPYSTPLGQAGWINANTPAREMPDGSGNKYTVVQLLNPTTSINAATAYLAQLYQQTGSYQGAAGAYNGSGPNGAYAQDVINRMNICILQGG